MCEREYTSVWPECIGTYDRGEYEEGNGRMVVYGS